MRQVRQIMGLPITIDIPGCEKAAFFEPVFKRLRQIDERFSTYKSGSEVSKFRRGEIKDADLSPELKAVIKSCERAENNTNGYFSAYYTGQFDPSGYVKGWAINEAGKLIKKCHKTFCMSAGGDILAGSDGGKIWQIGIQDPTDKNKILELLSISSGAVATSGNYERGAHIINPKTGRPAEKLLSVTAAGPDIIKADILATAIFASGQPELINIYPDYQAIAVDKQGKISRHSPENNQSSAAPV